MDKEEVNIEEQVAAESQDSFEMMREPNSVTDQHLYADGLDGKEKEAMIPDPISGASSAADASTGIPSAIRQQSLQSVPPRQTQTPFANRTEHNLEGRNP